MIDLLDTAPPDAEEFVVSWLTPLGAAGAVGTKRPTGAVLPYRLVHRVAGADDEMQISDNPVVSVHTFGNNEEEASREAGITHRRMLYLARYPLADVTMSGGVLANLEYLETVEGPTWQPYGDDSISRYVARYRFGLHFVAV